jgi:hypothetical protein
MEPWIALLKDAIDILGLDFVLRALVQAGVLPSWVLPDVFTAQEHTAYYIEGRVDLTNDQLNSSVHGLDAIMTQTKRNAFDVSGIMAALSNIETMIGNLPTPPTPPSSDANAAAVWNYVVGIAQSAGDMLTRLEVMGDHIGRYAALPWNLDPNFAVIGPWKIEPQD